MKLKHIKTATSFDLWFIPKFDDELLEGQIGYIKPSNSTKEYHLVLDDNVILLSLRDVHQQGNLDFHLKRGCAQLAEITQLAQNNSLLVRLLFFNGSVIEMGDIEVAIDEQIELTAKRNGIKFKNTEELAQLLNEKSCISVGAKTYFLMMTGAASNKDFDYEEQPAKNEDSDEVQQSELIQNRQFAIYGEQVRIPVEQRAIDKLSEIYFASKIIFKDSDKQEAAIRLVRGKITFSDYTKTGKIRALAADAMSRLTKDSGSYLKQWDEYGEIEGEMLLAAAKAVGQIDYYSTEVTANGSVKFFLDGSAPNNLTEGDELEITSVKPIYIQNPDISWQEYSLSLEEDYQAKQENNSKNNNDFISAIIIRLSDKSIELKLPSPPNEGNFLILSINGNKIQIERRMKARALILEGRSANPLLGLLIEEGGEIPDIQRITKLKPLTPFVKSKIFKHDPTDRQIEAIDIALNTPDIALIQGPPGTGKTTVVTAILERLNELHDKTHSIRGQILVSGFQHDAVENIISRLSVNALPAVKFGRRSIDSEFTEEATSKKITAWCTQVADKIRAKNPQIAQTEEQKKLNEAFILYSISPSINNTNNLLKLILNLPRTLLNADLVAKTETLLNENKLENKLSNNLEIRTIRSLRISETGFLDDGSEKAMAVIEAFEELLDTNDLKALEKAARWKVGKELNFLKDLKRIKKNLLEQYIPRPQFSVEKPRENILQLIAEVSKQLEIKHSNTNKHEIILAEFLHELEDNPDGVREAIEDYNFVFAATTQQAEGAAIRRAKTKFNDDFVKYDTVIIDEAARVSPRDLLIPMAQAEKRIILVGDHRQLPHIIDEEIAKMLENDDDKQDNDFKGDFVKKSMFEYLFHRLKKLEQKDGIKRTVTLDAQYRTHPLLGEFASQNFYAQYNEAYRSPLPKKLFQQNLQDTHGKAAIWINVPNSKGQEDKDGTSRKRNAEAKVIADKLKLWIDSEEGQSLSFGVISFYKAQVNTVFKELSHYNITEKAADGTWQFSEAYRFVKKQEDGKEIFEERLRIGTVDSFQGMEFDVVFLSMVRSQNMKNLPAYIKKENDYKKRQQKIFGHLMSENRLCVSMSRQKKLLIVVGDGELIQEQIAVDAVPALNNYYKLCAQQGVLL